MKSVNGFLDSCRQLVRQLMTVIARSLNKLSGGRLTPNMVTYTGLVAHIFIAWLIAMQDFQLAAVLLIVFGLFDALDGALARIQKTESSRGMFLDSVTDRIKEVLLYTGAAYALISSGNTYFAVWVVLACGAAVTVSYINAWGEVATRNIRDDNHKTNSSFRTGLMTYDIRIVTLIIGFLFMQLAAAIVVIAILSWLTVAQRFSNINKKF